METTDNQTYMQVALDLAVSVKGSTYPNPAVGAVLVKNGRVVGRGATQPAGSDHAEIVCIREAGAEAAGAALYVSLEPCAHTGATPPCTEAIIAAGITHVHTACQDPDPRVSGRGISVLRNAGITVSVGILADAAARLNEEFFRFMQSGRPWVHLKYAMTLDGRTASVAGDARWISGEASRTRVHEMRRLAQAVLVGRKTVDIDDPMLDCRLEGVEDKFQPRAVVVCGSGDIAPSSKIFSRNPLIITSQQGSELLVSRGLGAKCDVEVLAGTSFSVDDILAALARRSIISVLVEGGSQTISGLVRAGRVDRVSVFVAPKVLGSGYTPLEDMGLRLMNQALQLSGSWIPSGEDMLFEGCFI